MAAHEFLEHTADIRLRVSADSLSELFEESARGLTEFLFGAAVFQKHEEITEEIKLQADDAESLLVEWLSKLLALSLTRYQACVSVRVACSSRTSMTASVGFASAAAVEDVKAITYSSLRVAEGHGKFTATITFDL